MKRISSAGFSPPSNMMYDPDAYIKNPLEDPGTKENPRPLFVQDFVPFIKEVRYDPELRVHSRRAIL